MGDKNLHSGHRQRMIQKAYANPTILEEHELLEVFLYKVIPRKDTNPLAHRLIDTFGSINGVFSATAEELMLVKGVGKSVASNIVVMGKMYSMLKPEKPKKIKNAMSFDRIKDHVLAKFELIECERSMLFYLDKDYNIIKEVGFASLDVENVFADTSSVLKNFALYKPKFAVVAHNHPSGNAFPSFQDDFTTKKLNIVCAMHGVELIDHIIVAGSEAFSYHVSGRMQKVKDQANVDKVIRSLENDSLDD